MKRRKNRLDREMMIWNGVFAVALVLAIVFLFFLFFGIDVKKCETGLFTTIYMVTFGCVWGVLLCRNC